MATADRFVTFGRALTDTPLRRRYARTLGTMPAVWGGGFDPALHPHAAREAAAASFLALAAAEYGAAATSARILDTLILCGCPFDILAEASRVPCDELRHADGALRMAELCGGDEARARARCSRERADAARSHARTMTELDAIMADAFAIGETLAAALLTASRRAASDPTARAFYGALVADEVHHARLGWHYLEWRAPSWSTSERQAVADHAAAVVADVDRRLWVAQPVAAGFEPAARSLGVLGAVERTAAVTEVMEAEILPALDALGLGSSRAWRPRGAPVGSSRA